MKALKLDSSADLLIEEKSDGNIDTFLDFYRQYHKRVRGVLFRTGIEIELEDAVQEVFLKAWINLPAFEQRSSLQTWLVRIAVNFALDELRRRKARAATLSGIPDLRPAANTQSQQELSDLVQKSLATLDDEQRVLIVLQVFEGYDLQEIADILAMPLGTVKSRLFRTKKQLAAVLKTLGADP